MPEHLWSILCYKACVDEATNSVSILDVYEKIIIQNVSDPASLEKTRRDGKEAFFPIRMDLMSHWVRSDFEKPESGKLRLVLQPPTGKRLTLVDELLIDLDEHPRFRSRIQMPAMPYRGPGIYYFLVSLRQAKGWKRVAKIPFEIALSEEAQEQIS